MPDEIKREKMYGWYDPGHLLETGIRVGIATIFGEFLDRRELFGDRTSSTPPAFETSYDYSYAACIEHSVVGCEKCGDFWLDFVCDTGDGWDSTFAVARLLARAGLNFEPKGGNWIGTKRGRTATSPEVVETKRGRVLIYGGDEVYSTASQEAYRTRLIVPFEHAAEAENTVDDLKKLDTYAIPGNHDWYDGLNSFMNLFVARRAFGPADGFGSGRRVGYRRARQGRSYFALKLPGNWWLIGADAQLKGYIDQGQISFFDDLAQHVMEPGSNIILCAATPCWYYIGLEGPADKVFSSHAYLEAVITGVAHNDDAAMARRHHLRVVMTGDAHHYARYMEQLGEPSKQDPNATMTDVSDKARCYLTWGGGGAFLHPTHQLRDVDVEWLWPPPPPVSPLNVTEKNGTRRRTFRKAKVYPSDEASRDLAGAIPMFGINNPQFSVLMGVFGLIVAWALAGAADLAGKRLPETIRDAESIGDALWELVLLLLTFPWVLLTCVALVGVLVYFSDAKGKWTRPITGIVHFLCYLVSFFTIFFVLARCISADLDPVVSAAVLVVSTAIATMIVAPTIMGCYLYVSLLYRRHWNEAFSSLRIKDYKGFLRLRITANGELTVYPIAIDTVPPRGEGDLVTRLIERPIHVKPPESDVSKQVQDFRTPPFPAPPPPAGTEPKPLWFPMPPAKTQRRPSRPKKTDV
jgi:hypothetical protein